MKNEDQDFTSAEIAEIKATKYKDDASLGKKFGCSTNSVTQMRRWLNGKGEVKIAAKPVRELSEEIDDADVQQTAGSVLMIRVKGNLIMLQKTSVTAIEVGEDSMQIIF